jgi:hypothetical protein
MRIIWCKNLEDVVSVAMGHGWLLHLQMDGRHYYYVYAGVESEIICIATRSDSPISARYVTIGDEGELKTSGKPIMPACARIVEVAEDRCFEECVRSSAQA